MDKESCILLQLVWIRICWLCCSDCWTWSMRIFSDLNLACGRIRKFLEPWSSWYTDGSTALDWICGCCSVFPYSLAIKCLLTYPTSLTIFPSPICPLEWVLLAPEMPQLGHWIASGTIQICPTIEFNSNALDILHLVADFNIFI